MLYVGSSCLQVYSEGAIALGKKASEEFLWSQHKKTWPKTSVSASESALKRTVTRTAQTLVKQSSLLCFIMKFLSPSLKQADTPFLCPASLLHYVVSISSTSTSSEALPSPTPAPDPPLSSPSQPVSSNKSYVPHQYIMYSCSAFSVFINYIYAEFKEPLRATRIITKKKNPADSWAPSPAPWSLLPKVSSCFLVINSTVLTETKTTRLHCKFLVLQVLGIIFGENDLAIFCTHSLIFPHGDKSIEVISIYVYIAVLLLFPLWTLPSSFTPCFR